MYFHLFQNASIVVFPENGLYGPGFAREALWPYLEFVPDPTNTLSWNPCQEGDRYSKTDVQHRLSCVAKSSSLYLVANIGSVVPCDGVHCPPDGHFQYSTSVVYDPKGNFVARYRKQNLMKHPQFDPPGDVDAVSFKTPFGKFGLLTSWDLLFHDPTLTLVKDLDIENLILSASWTDTAPFLTAVEFHSAFAMGLGVNLMAANLHLLKKNIHGSGIYTPEGPAVYYYNTNDTQGKLLVSEIKDLSKPRPEYSPEKTDILFFNGLQTDPPYSHHKGNNSAYLHYSGGNSLEGPYHHSGTNSTTFQSRVNHDLFQFIELTKQNATLKICHKSLCCTIEYSMEPAENETFAFGAFDGLHSFEGSYYTQICSLLKCEPKAMCGSPVSVIDTTFSSLHIRGSFSTQYVYPELMVSDQGNASLAPGEFQFRDRSLVITNSSMHLLSAALYSIVYAKSTSAAHALIITRLYLMPFAAFVITSFRFLY